MNRRCKCGAALRSKRTPAEAAPGTRRHAGRGLCERCYYHTRPKRTEPAQATTENTAALAAYLTARRHRKKQPA